jgi:hypothetical protein
VILGEVRDYKTAEPTGEPRVSLRVNAESPTTRRAVILMGNCRQIASLQRRRSSILVLLYAAAGAVACTHGHEIISIARPRSSLEAGQRSAPVPRE